MKYMSVYISLEREYITEHIAPKLFYPHELEKNREINCLLTKSLIYLPMSLPSSLFHKYVNEIGMMRLCDLQNSGGEILDYNLLRSSILHFFPL